MKVEQFYNKNQFIMHGEGKIIFQSYNSTIAIYQNGILTLGRHWDYSTTTSKHLYLFISDYVNILTDGGYSLKSELRNSTNKRKIINNLIEKNIIVYDERLA